MCFPWICGGKHFLVLIFFTHILLIRQKIMEVFEVWYLNDGF